MPNHPDDSSFSEYARTVVHYSEQFGIATNSDDVRRRRYAELVNQYFDLVTDAYLMGWGRCFHFAPRRKRESLHDSILRYERLISEKLELGVSSKVLDLGCGVGGPMINLARLTGAEICGVNNNAYQIEKGRRFVQRAGLEGRCQFVKADFMAMPFADESIDAIYSIDAFPHAPDKTALFREIQRVLRPGGQVCASDWCLKDCYDEEKSGFQQERRELEIGNGLPGISTINEVIESVRASGLHLLEHRDLAEECDAETPWYLPLTTKGFSMRAFVRTKAGHRFLSRLLSFCESAGILPKGSSEVLEFLEKGADALLAGGKAGFFTPLFFIHAKKPDCNS